MKKAQYVTNSFIVMLLLSVSWFSSVTLAAEQNQAQERVIILLGAPGSGKGTQAVRLSKELNLPHISTGDILRENLKNGSELGKQAKTYMDTGKLVPDEIVLDMLYKRLAQSDTAKGYILDGFPRTIEQAKNLDAKIAPKHPRITVINLEVKDETIVQRIIKRSKENKGPKRSDDTAEIAQKRLKHYHKQTKPLVNYYQDKNVLITIDGERKPDEIFEDIKEKLKKAAVSQ